MKSLFKVIFLASFPMVFNSCLVLRKPIETRVPQNNRSYQVDYLFEHDGCKVYRFMDKGNYVYFTNCSGNVTSISRDSTKTRIANQILSFPKEQ